VSFTREVKRELAGIQPSAEHCRRAQLSGLLFGAGTFEISGHGHYTVRMSLGLPATARCGLGLLKGFGVAAELRTVSGAPGGRRYEIVLGDEDRHLQLLTEVGVLSDTLRVQWSVPRRLVTRQCCLVAFVRGMFLGCGSVSTPGTPVHAEFTVEDEDLAADLLHLLGRLDLPFALTVRARNIGVYTKRGETAADLLALLGAHDARLRWEEHAVLGRVRESANRLANCDEANARRAAEAGRRQAEAARTLRASELWAGLPAGLRAVAELRLRYPYLSLQELAGRAHPPLSKSSLNHRFRRLAELAADVAPVRATRREA
jgi:DNA-binding protein WhiA